MSGQSRADEFNGQGGLPLSTGGAAGDTTAWYAVHTQPHAETKALDNLLRQGYRAYLPRCKIWVSHARRRQLALRPLFPRYLFAGLHSAAMRWRPILSTVGVSDVVRSGDRPASVPSGIVAAIRDRERDGAFDGLDPQHSLHPGELVRVTSGAFADLVGRLVELRERDRAVVLLELLGRAVRAELALEAVVAA